MNMRCTQKMTVNSRIQKIAGLSDFRCMKYAATIEPLIVATINATAMASATAR